jgi:putative ABC transport system permease protein
VFVSLAIFIAALGLFGVAAFTVQRRTREIGLRKVFGAQTWEVVVLLVWQFSRPVLLANLIAWPVAWYFLRDWLDGYAHRVSLSPVYFVMGGMAALFVAWATVIGHALAVARERPVRALRYE